MVNKRKKGNRHDLYASSSGHHCCQHRTLHGTSDDRAVLLRKRALRDLSGPEFTLAMQRFLKITRIHPLNYAMVLTSGILPVAVLVMLRENLGSSSFVLSAIGLLAFWCGSILPSTFIAQPLYGDFMSWEIDAPPQDWRETRDRYFRVNVVRGLGSAIAFVCFVIAAMLLPL